MKRGALWKIEYRKNKRKGRKRANKTECFMCKGELENKNTTLW